MLCSVMSKHHVRVSAASSGLLPGRGSSNIAVARYVAFAMLLALGACTIITAGLLLTRTIEKPSDALMWVGRQPMHPATVTAAAAAAAAVAAAPEAIQKPLTKDLDPDYVEPKAQQAVTFSKECPTGCEKQGNCNAEEGR